MDISNKKKFFVIGLGKSGRAVARLLADKGFNVAAYDDDLSTAESFASDPGTAVSAQQIVVVTTENLDERIDGADCIVVSPGIPLDHVLVKRAVARGIEIVGELEVAYHFCSADIVGVTGTNGKSTVVSLLGDIFAAAGKRCVVAGNIGTPFSTVVAGDDQIDVIVLEISSFQLDTIKDFRARVAVLLNVTADHLDRYDGSFDKYAQSKARILDTLGAQSWFVYNTDDPVCRRIASTYSGRAITFGSSPMDGDAVFIDDASIVRAWRGSSEVVMPVAGFTPVGIHNLENAMAAVASATPFDIDRADAAKALRAYRPLPHRMELARVVGGVAYVNDSKATNVDATVKSVRSIDGQLVLIMGGIDKGGDYAPLVEHLGNVIKVVLIGEATDRIAAALEGHCDMARADSMEAAVRVAADAARSGDTVLLAPACSSFDMFSDYAARGEAFKTAVGLL